jgi:hypothetical protein
MSRRPIEDRQFGDWQMAFRNMSKDCAAEEGSGPFLEPDAADEDLSEESQLVYRLLRRFKDDIR